MAKAITAVATLRKHDGQITRQAVHEEGCCQLCRIRKHGLHAMGSV